MSNHKLIYISLEREEARLVAKFLKSRFADYQDFVAQETGDFITQPPSIAFLDDAVDYFNEDFIKAEVREAIIADESISEEEKCHRLLDTTECNRQFTMAQRIDLLLETLEQVAAQVEELEKRDTQEGGE